MGVNNKLRDEKRGIRGTQARDGRGALGSGRSSVLSAATIEDVSNEGMCRNRILCHALWEIGGKTAIICNYFWFLDGFLFE